MTSVTSPPQWIRLTKKQRARNCLRGSLCSQERCAAMPEDPNCRMNVAPNGLYGQRCGSSSVKLPPEWDRNDAAQWTRYRNKTQAKMFFFSHSHRCVRAEQLLLVSAGAIESRATSHAWFECQFLDADRAENLCLLFLALTHARTPSHSLISTASTLTAPQSHDHPETVVSCPKSASFQLCLSAQNGASSATLAARSLYVGSRVFL